jgi:hypothetical protein
MVFGHLRQIPPPQIAISRRGPKTTKMQQSHGLFSGWSGLFGVSRDYRTPMGASLRESECIDSSSSASSEMAYGRFGGARLGTSGRCVWQVQFAPSALRTASW